MILNNSEQNFRFYRISILVWALFISYEILFSYLLTGILSTTFDYFTSYLINIVLFYVNALVILPKSYGKPYYKGILLFSVEFISYVAGKYLIAIVCLKLGQSKIDPLDDPLNYFILTVWRYIYFMGISIGYWFSMNVIAQRRKISELEKNKLVEQLKTQALEKRLIDSDIAYLKSQINPHFLFNALNFIYNSSIEISPKLGTPISILSDIMRYAFSEVAKDGKVYLQEEVDQIRSCIDLYQLRYEKQLNVSISVEGELGKFRILPLILLTAVENMFKYGDLKKNEDPSTIKLMIADGKLNFSIANRKLSGKKNGAGRGIGLKNLKSRLDVYYPEAHKISIIEDDSHYNFKLFLNL